MNKNIIILILILGVVFLLLLRKCEGGKGQTITKVEYDTVFVTQKKDTSYIPQPYAVYLRGERITNFDTLYLPEVVTDSTCLAYYEVLKDYFSRHYLYTDTVRNQYGYVAINDTITQNKIAGRGTSMNFTIPEITKTITLTQPKRNQVYIGANLLGNKSDVLKGYNVNLSLKTKQDRMIEVGYNKLFKSDHYYSIGLKWKISLTKK